jgi:hypothetical protein
MISMLFQMFAMLMAGLIGVLLIPVTAIIAIPDFIYSIKDSLCR